MGTCRAVKANIPMRTFSRYLARGMYGRIGFVLLGFVALFALFDFVSELEEIGRGDYRMVGGPPVHHAATPSHGL